MSITIETDDHWPTAKTDRNAEWCRLYREGKTSGEIADAYGVTRERVCQILRKENLIAHKAQRRQLAREMLEEDRAVIRAAKGQMDKQLVGLVRSGMSIAQAAGIVGFTEPQANWVCKRLGVISMHGRWRNFESRKNRIRQLVDEGHVFSRVLEIVSGEEGRKVSYQWAWHNVPDAVHKAKGARKTARDAKRIERLLASMAVARPIAVVKAAPPETSPAQCFEAAYWSDEKTARLISLWNEGKTAQEISETFRDCSRNAVLGRLHRLRRSQQLQIGARA